jgi:hypothetical protein
LGGGDAKENITPAEFNYNDWQVKKLSKKSTLLFFCKGTFEF